MTDHDTHLATLFGRPASDDERAAASAQAARLEAGIFDNPILRLACDLQDPLLASRLRSADLVDLPLFSVPAP